MNPTTTHTTDSGAINATRSRHWFMEVFSAIARLIRHRRATAKLLELNDHYLADIGVTRADVLRALNSSPLRDPTMELNRIAGRRH